MTENENNSNEGLLENNVPVASTISLLILTIYIFIYLIFSIWLFIEGWLNDFRSLNIIWRYPADEVFPPMLR